MAFARSQGKRQMLPTVMQSQRGGALQGYGTPEGVEKSWNTRGRGRKVNDRFVDWRRRAPGSKARGKRELHQMGRTKVGSNISSMTRGGTTIYYSYDTPVAVRTNKGLATTRQKFSTTTSKHIGVIHRKAGYPNSRSASQAAIQRLEKQLQTRYSR